MFKRRDQLTEDTANEVWTLLVAKAGARENERAAFVRYLTSPESSGHEYRFIGLLGFGGKLHFNEYRGARVSCYPEDADEVRDAIITTVNDQLAAIVPSRERLISGEGT